MLRAPTEHLIGDGRDHGDEEDAPDDADQQALAGQQAEQDDAHQDEHDQELSAAAGMRRGIAPRVLDGQRQFVLERMDGHVLGAVVLEHPSDIRRPAHHQQVAHEDDDTDEGLDEVLDERIAATDHGIGGALRREQR